MKLSERRLWLTIDSDDIRHLPRYQGHPLRSRHPLPMDCTKSDPSPKLKIGMEGFSRWFAEAGEVTLFLIADQLDSVDFKNWLKPMLDTGRLRIASHGNTHRSWAAWPEDVEGFTAELQIATKRLKEFSGEAWRPWFRAPAGYIAPWMAQVLSKLGKSISLAQTKNWPWQQLEQGRSGDEEQWFGGKTMVNKKGAWIISPFLWSCTAQNFLEEHFKATMVVSKFP